MQCLVIDGLVLRVGHGIAVGIYAFISAFGLLVVEKSVLVFSIVQLLGVGILTTGCKVAHFKTL